MSSLGKLQRIVIFGAEYCSFCKKAQKMLSKAQVKFDYLDVEEDKVMQELQNLQKQYNYRTIPMIFIDEKFIGGYSELYKMVDEKTIDLNQFK